jgi:hypothetical protein
VHAPSKPLECVLRKSLRAYGEERGTEQVVSGVLNLSFTYSLLYQVLSMKGGVLLLKSNNTE